jgi:hypothetical protein
MAKFSWNFRRILPAAKQHADTRRRAEDADVWRPVSSQCAEMGRARWRSGARPRPSPALGGAQDVSTLTVGWGNPSYAGTYVFGRYQACKQIGPAGEICTRSRRMPQDEWRVVIPDHHPGYISCEQFLTNRQRLAANRTNCEVLAGPAREGFCLLQGLILRSKRPWSAPSGDCKKRGRRRDGEAYHHPVVSMEPDRHHPLRPALACWFRQSAKLIRSQDRAVQRCWGRRVKPSMPDRCRSVSAALSIDGTEPP